MLLGYPIETVLAEKISTAVSLGEANTRVRDYVDLYTLTGRHQLSYATVRAALDGDHLSAELAEVVLAIEAFVDPLATGDVGQGRWVPAIRRWE